MMDRCLRLYPKSNSSGLYPLHRVLMENKLNRMLLTSEVIHHLDENKENNSIDNLVIMTNAEHVRLHQKPLSTISTNCGECDCVLTLKPHVFRQRISRSKSGLIFCSHKCASLLQPRIRTRSVTLNCIICGKEILIMKSRLKSRQERNKSGNIACSYSCGTQLRRV